MYAYTKPPFLSCTTLYLYSPYYLYSLRHMGASVLFDLALSCSFALLNYEKMFLGATQPPA
jgi:hypothetical protein